jgi:uncharacterized protein YodC (DUF2158 family)
VEGLHLQPVAHVLPLTTIRRARKLPVPGVVTVRQNERVQAHDVLAEAEAAPKHKFIELARALGVRPREVPRLIVREYGERVEKGDIIAGPVGFARRTVRAPAQGRVLTLTDGRLLFEMRGEIVTIKAGFPGMVVSTDGVQTVAVENTGSLIHCAWGNGRQDFGVMRVVGEDSGSRLMTDQLDIELRGAILVAGLCDHPAPLQQARELAVRGIILGGLSARLIPEVSALPYPVVVTEGFGQLFISPPIFDLLRTNQGREVSIDARPAEPYEGRRPEVIIPLPVANPVDIPEDVVPLATGVRVRVARAPYQGEVGIVQQVLPNAVSYPSGVLARSARVDLPGKGAVRVPLANLEVLQ